MPLIEQVVEIPHLPRDLRVVPSGNHKDWDQNDEWKDWAKDVLKHRIITKRRADDSESRQAIERRRCRDDPNYEMVMYGYIDEPRRLFGQGRAGSLPFLLFPRQIQLGHEIAERRADPDHRHLWVDKSRGFGATLYIVQYILNRWKWEDAFSAYLMSFEEGMVKKVVTDEVGSLLAKFHYALERHPPWLKPQAFEYGSMGLLNQDPSFGTGNSVTGWTTTKRAGRSGRAALGFIDETAQVRYLNNVLASMGEAVDTILGASTRSNEISHDWSDLIENIVRNGDDDFRDTAYGSKKLGLFEIDYHHNPYMTEDWIARRRKEYEDRNDLARFNAEYLRDDRSLETGYIYPEVGNRPFSPEVDFNPNRVTVLGFDVGGDDFTAIVMHQLDYDAPLLTQGALELPQLNVVDSYINSGVPVDLYAHIVTGVLPDDRDIAYGSFNWDPQGPDIQFMQMTQLLKPDSWLLRMFSDPTANKAEIATRQNWINLFEEACERLYARRGIQYRPKVLYSYAEKFSHFHRQNVTQRAIPYMIFSTRLGARRVFDALKRRRLTNTLRPSAAAPVPMHERMWSDVATAVEYAMVGISDDIVPNRARRAPVVTDVSGRVIR